MEKEFTFWEHLEELRNRTIRIFIFFLLISVIAFVNKEFIFNVIILSPTHADFITNRFFCHLGRISGIEEMCINTNPIQLISINMSGQFMIHMNISVLSGFILSVPYMLWELWRFLLPALKPEEKKYFKKIVLISSLLFFLGILFSYYMIVPLTIDFFMNYQVSDMVENRININSFISSISSVTLACGFVFELPVLVYFLTKMGIINPDNLKKLRRYAIVLVLTISAILTPPDVFSQLLVSVPLYALYEISIYISRKVVKSNN